MYKISILVVVLETIEVREPHRFNCFKFIVDSDKEMFHPISFVRYKEN